MVSRKPCTSGADYYSKGVLTGFAVARTIAEQCETLDVLIIKLTERIMAADSTNGESRDK